MSFNVFQSIFYISACALFCYIALIYSKTLAILKMENQKARNLGIMLDEKDFKCLTGGGTLKIISLKTKQIIIVGLQDIGFDRMYNAISEAEKGKDLYKECTKIIEN